MDNLPKEENQQEDQSKGEIFSEEVSAYEQATAPPEAEGSTLPPQPSAEIPTDQGPPAEGAATPPPAYVEDKKKKYLLIGLGVFALLFFIFLIFNLLFKGKPKPPAEVTLTYWGLWEDKEIIQPILDEYKRTKPNITINYLKQDPKQYRERLKAAIDRGEGPDIFRFHNTWVPMFKTDLAAIPKTIYPDAEFERAFFPVVASNLKLGDNFYGIPLMIDGLLLFYNEDILKGANVAMPVTWVDVQNALPKLTVREKGRIVTAGIAMGTAENVEHFSDILGLMMLQNGTALHKSLSTCADPKSTTCSVEALTFYKKIAEPPNNSWDDTLDNSIVAFSGGKVAMIFAPSWQAFVIKSLNPNLNFKTAKVPQLPCDSPPCPSVNWATYWVEGVSNKSKYQKESFEFLKFLTSEITMKKLYELQVKSRVLFGEPYSRVDLAKTLTDNPYLSPLIAQAPTMKSFYLASRTFDGETGLNSTLTRYLKDAVNSLSAGVSVETALKTADDGFKQVYSRFGIAASAQ